MPMGMLIGELVGQNVFGRQIYQAIILNKALDEIEFDYPHQVLDIRLFHLQDNIWEFKSSSTFEQNWTRKFTYIIFDVI